MRLEGFPFLAGGEMGALMRAHDWAATPLGPVEQWPSSLRTVVALMLEARQPVYVAWGPQQISLYNDGYIPICGHRHPAGLGKPAQELWSDIWTELAPINAAVLRGESLWFEDKAFALAGRVEAVSYFSFSYTPLRDETGAVAGIFCAATETTDKVMAGRRRVAEAARQRRMFEQAPSLISILRGPDHIVDFVNNAHRAVFNSGAWLGRPAREAFPGLIGQGYYERLDQVYATGERYVAKAAPMRFQPASDAAEQVRWLDITFEPVLDDSGEVIGIFCQGVDVTASHQVEQALRASEARQAVLLQLLRGQRETEDPETMMAAAAEAVGQHLRANRVGFFEMFGDEFLLFGASWADGTLVPLQGRWAAGNIGSRYLALVRAGQTVGIADTATDPLTADSGFGDIGARAIIGAPVIRGGRWHAGLYVNHASVRHWTADEIAFVREVADATWDAVERARALSAMRESEQLFHEIADAAPVLIWISDTTMAATWFNQLWLDFTGRPLRHELGDGWTRGIHPDDRDNFITTYTDAFKRCATFRIDFRLRRRDGAWRVIDDQGVPHFSADGTFLGYIGSCVDVTDQRVAEQALRHSEEQLRLATDAAEIGLWDVDNLTGTLFWPTRVRAMFGISPDAPISLDDFYAGLHPDDRERIAAAYAAAVDPARRARYDVEYRTIGKEDGVTRWVAAKGRALFNDAGTCVRVIGTALDITTRKQYEERLRELNETLERRVATALAERKILADVVESTDAFIQVADPDYRWLAINRASAHEFERIFGVRPSAGDNMLDLLRDRPEHRSALQAVWGRALAGEEFTVTEPFGDPSRDRRHYEMKFNTLRDRDGRIIGAYQFAYDVTDKLRDQARLAEAEEQLRQAQKIEAIGQLTGGVAHDFNNLLMVISGGLSILDRQRDPARRERILGSMRQAAERGASLSRQLLAFSRRQPLKAEPIDLVQQIEAMHDLLDRTLRGDVQVATRFAPDLWPIKVDPAELELAVLNLCVNARDAMPQGGAITIEACNIAHLQRGELKGDFVRLSVTDTGVGMSKDVLARAFEPFFTTKEVGKGSGLGLPQVYGFARQSGGITEIQSIAGQGTSVVLLLPRSEVLPVTPADKLVDLASKRQGADADGAVLMVEDDDEVAALVSEMLGQLGYDVTRVASADAALGALANDRPVDIVFSDIMMPGRMNGLALAREIRRRRPGLPVLLTSGYSEATRHDAEAEHIEVLRKPYGLGELAAALRRVTQSERKPVSLETSGARGTSGH